MLVCIGYLVGKYYNLIMEKILSQPIDKIYNYLSRVKLKNI